MSATTNFEVLEQAYLRWHRNEATTTQKDLASELNISHSVLNNLLGGKHVYSAQLEARYPGLRRAVPLAAPKVGRPVKTVAVVEVEVVEEPEIDLAMEACETLRGLSPVHAVVFAKSAFAELSELMRLVNRKCPRLERYLTLPGRPGRPKGQKDEQAVKQDEDIDLAERERLSKAFLGEDE